MLAGRKLPCKAPTFMSCHPQDEAPMAERKQATFAVEEGLESLFGMTVEVDSETQAEGQIAAYFADGTVTDNPPERAAPKSPLPYDGKLDEMKQQYSEMMEAINY